MGAEHDSQWPPYVLLCPNCGQRVGYMGDSSWFLVPELVCSRACGVRLQKKRECGMAPPAPQLDPADARALIFRAQIQLLGRRQARLRWLIRKIWDDYGKYGDVCASSLELMQAELES